MTPVVLTGPVSRGEVQSLLDTAVSQETLVSGLAGGGGARLFESQWDTATGTGASAVTDGGTWDDHYSCSRTDVLSTVSASGVDPAWTRSPNLLRVNWGAEEGACGALQKLDAVAPAQNHYGRLFYRRVDQTYGLSEHNFSYRFVGNIEAVFFNPVVMPFGSAGVAADGWCFSVVLGRPGPGYPYNRWYCQTGPTVNPFARPDRKFAYDAWYLYEWYIEFVTSTTYRFYPRISSYNAVTNTATLIADVNDMRPTDAIGGMTMQEWYNLGNSFNVENTDNFRDIGVGNEGRASHPLLTTMHYIADFAIGTGDWLGVAA